MPPPGVNANALREADVFMHQRGLVDNTVRPEWNTGRDGATLTLTRLPGTALTSPITGVLRWRNRVVRFEAPVRMTN